MAMANQMPVVSTPYHFAVEVLQDSRGVIIPYADQNSSLLGAALSSLLGSAPLREGMVSDLQHNVSTTCLAKCERLSFLDHMAS